jgi:hypothetical protein
MHGQGCRSVKKKTRARISHGACMQGALHPFTHPKALQTTITKVLRTCHPANHTLTFARTRSRGLSLPYRLLHITPPHADRSI